jgi:hypothetical protein
MTLSYRNPEDPYTASDVDDYVRHLSGRSELGMTFQLTHMNKILRLKLFLPL